VVKIDECKAPRIVARPKCANYKNSWPSRLINFRTSIKLKTSVERESVCRIEKIIMVRNKSAKYNDLTFVKHKSYEKMTL